MVYKQQLLEFLRLYQGVVKPTETLKQGVCHIALSAKDKEQITSSGGSEEETREPEVVNNVQVESDDEDENEEVQEETSSDNNEEEEQVEPEPEPEPEKPKKKRVIKKKA